MSNSNPMSWDDNGSGDLSFSNPNDDFFNSVGNGMSNDAQSSANSGQNGERAGSADEHRGSMDDGVPRMKRIACVVCRKRKLKCDGLKPSCGTCARLGHDCSYDEIRRKSGPKRGYVKALEARLAQVETLLKTQDPADPAITGSESQHYDVPYLDVAVGSGELNQMSGLTFTNDPMSGEVSLPDAGNMGFNDALNEPQLSWDMIQMGLDEALPDPSIIDDLHRIYFDKVHPSQPMLHRTRYLANLNLSPQSRPPICLRYAMWTLAASVADEYLSLQTVFYRRARKYAEEAELKGHGETMISIAHAQTWAMIATYEFKLMYFPRAWLSVGRAVRLSQMMGLHRLDGLGLDVKQCLAPPKDWTEREERRRTFWAAFCVDRYASIGTGWPMIIDEKDILTNLPATEESFEKGRPMRTLSLKESMTDQGASSLSAFASVVLMAALFGRNLIHLHRPDPDDNDDDVENGEFWRRHRHMDNILINTSLSLPAHLKLPAGVMDPNIVFTNMNLHTSTICLHQAAIFKADKNRLPNRVSNESKHRCIVAAAHIASIMKMISSQDLSMMNPFISFCLYVAARVFVQYLKSKPNDEQIRSSLQFLLTAMGHLKKMNPLTESFLVQLDVDLSSSLDHPVNNSKFPYSMKKGAAEIYVPDREIAPQDISMPSQNDLPGFSNGGTSYNVNSPSQRSNSSRSTMGLSPSQEPISAIKDGNKDAKFLYCERTVMNLSHEQVRDISESQSLVSPPSVNGSPGESMGQSTTPSEYNTPTHSASTSQPPKTNPINNPNFGPGHCFGSLDPDRYISDALPAPTNDFVANMDISEMTGMSGMTDIGGFGKVGSTGMGMGMGMGVTPSFMNGDPFDLDNLTADQSDAIFSEMLSMGSPSQWLNAGGGMQ